MIKENSDRNIMRIKVKHIHPSAVLPPRGHGTEIADSVKSTGLQQSLIVRPLASQPDEYEIIDGAGRLAALDPDQEVYADVRPDAVDSEVFRISGATFKRTDRNTAETSAFYAAYVEAVKKETGEKGAKRRVAKEACISDSQLSQFLSISRLFADLRAINQTTKFEKLEAMGINRVYELAKLENNAKLLEIAKEIEEKADFIAAETIRDMVQKANTSALEEISADLKVVEEKVANAVAETVDATPVDKMEPVTESESAAKEHFGNVVEDLMACLRNIETSLSTIRSHSFSEAQLSSGKTQATLQKILTSIRRLSSYIKTLKKETEAIEHEQQMDTASQN